MTGKLPESGHHWLVCGCGIALPPSTLAPALKLSRNTLVDRNAQTHTDTHTVYQGSRNLSACIRREASFRVSKFPSTDRGDTDRNHTTPYFSAKKVLRNHYHVCIMQFNVHRVLLPRTKHMLFFFPTQVGTLQKCLRTQKQHSRGICELGPSQAVWYERAYIYTQPGWVTPGGGRSFCVCLSFTSWPETEARELLVHLFGLLPPGWVAPQSL